VIGYCVPENPNLASYRLRVSIPQKHLGIPSRQGLGDVTFFFKNGCPLLASRIDGPVVYDVVNPHFSDPDYQAMVKAADVVTCSSPAMQWAIRKAFGLESVVIPDPYENEERKAACEGDKVVWFGHQANLNTLEPYRDLNPVICTGENWSRQQEDKDLASAAVVLLTGSNPGASSNRPVKALRAGRFVVCPEESPPSWKELADFIWIGDVREGVRWALDNREEACRKVTLGQQFVKTRFSPQSIGSQWADLFASILGRDTNKKTAGSALTSP
jgi:hypothetical protein